MTNDLQSRTYAASAKMDVHELVRQLTVHLGPTLVATLANVRSRQMPHKWAQADGPIPSPESHRRLMAAHRIWSAISEREGDDTARAWFIGANPRLGEEAPSFVLRKGDLKEVLAAAQAFLDGIDD